MQSNSEKRQARLERKKQKLAALVNLTKLNDMDKKFVQQANEEIEPEPKRLRSEDTEPVLMKLATSPTKEEVHLVKHPSEDIKEIIKVDTFGKRRMTDEQVKEFKKQINERRKQLNPPKFRLQEHGEMASIEVDMEARIPIFLTDVQHLIMYSQLGFLSSYSPARWCHLEKFNRLARTNVLIVENVSLFDFLSNESHFPFINAHFNIKVEMLTPRLYNGDSVQELATVALTSTQLRKYCAHHGSIEKAADKCPEVFNFVKKVFPMSKAKVGYKGQIPDKFPRTDILLSGWQMVEENFPLPIKGLWERKYKGYVLTKDVYAEVTPFSPMYGLDCEMCQTTVDLELTRVSIVDEHYQTIYDELVKPDNHIIDYLTQYSGITKMMMQSVTKRLCDVQREIQQLLPPDAIIVGQSVNNDFHALKMMHPYIIDTSICYNITGTRGRKTKLKTLSMEFLSENIQAGHGHCSTEDSLASLKLAQLKLSKDIFFGDAVMSNIQIQVRPPAELGTPDFATSMLKKVTGKDRRAFVAAQSDLAQKYCYFTTKNEKDLIDTKCLVVKRGESSEDVVQKMVAKTTSNLKIGHIRMESESEVALGLGKIDNWARLIYEGSQKPALNIVVFTGGRETGNGCCFINLKT